MAVRQTDNEKEEEFARTKELTERLVTPGNFPNMSASEGHELYAGIQKLFALAGINTA